MFIKPSKIESLFSAYQVYSQGKLKSIPNHKSYIVILEKFKSGKIKNTKLGKNYYTTERWLSDYIKSIYK